VLPFTFEFAVDCCFKLLVMLLLPRLYSIKSLHSLRENMPALLQFHDVIFAVNHCCMAFKNINILPIYNANLHTLYLRRHGAYLKILNGRIFRIYFVVKKVILGFHKMANIIICSLMLKIENVKSPENML
jgi:hypothetical protein